MRSDPPLAVQTFTDTAAHMLTPVVQFGSNTGTDRPREQRNDTNTNTLRGHCNAPKTRFVVPNAAISFLRRTFAHSGPVVNDKGGDIFIIRHGGGVGVLIERGIELLATVLWRGSNANPTI
jgi:hypothetical protein